MKNYLFKFTTPNGDIVEMYLRVKEGTISLTEVAE